MDLRIGVRYPLIFFLSYIISSTNAFVYTEKSLINKKTRRKPSRNAFPSHTDNKFPENFSF